MERPGQKSHDNFYVESNWCWLCLLLHDMVLSNVLQLWRPSGYSQTLIICQIMLSDLQRHPRCSCKEINDFNLPSGEKKKKGRKRSLAISSLRVHNGLNVECFDKIPSPSPILLKYIFSVSWDMIVVLQNVASRDLKFVKWVPCADCYGNISSFNSLSSMQEYCPIIQRKKVRARGLMTCSRSPGRKFMVHKIYG